MPTSGKGPQVTAGQKGPKEPIRSPKNNPARSPGENGERWRSAPPLPRVFPMGIAPSLFPPGCQGRACPPGLREGHTEELRAGRPPRGYIWKRIWKPFQQICARGSGPLPRPAPRVAPRPVAALLAASRSSPSAGLFLERETTPEKLQRQVLPAQAPREATAPRASRGSHSVPARFACSALKIQ